MFTSPFFLFALIASLGIFGFVVPKNRLYTSFHKVEQAYQNLLVAIEKRNANLASIKENMPSYLAKEKGLLQDLDRLLEENQKAQKDKQLKIQLARDFDRVLVRLKKLINLQRASAESKKDVVIMASINEFEEQLSASKRSYNAAVNEYNKNIDVFPSSLIANFYNYDYAPTYSELKEDYEELELKDLEKTKVYEEFRRDNREDRH